MDPSHTPQSRSPQNKHLAENASAEESVTPLNIVALDDDPDFREYIQGVLAADSHAVRVAATPEEFFRMCEAELPDAVLLDIKMGRHSGEEVLAEIRQRWAKLCVIVVTGYPTMEGMRQTFKQDVFDYLSKPFSIAELRRVLRQATAALGLGDSPQDRLRREIGHQIRMSRTGKGWTLRDLSEASGVSVSQLSTIERGSVFPSLESIVAIATALEVRPSAWFVAAGL